LTVAAHGTPGSAFGGGLGFEVDVFDGVGFGLLLELGDELGVSLLLGAGVLDGALTDVVVDEAALPTANGAPPPPVVPPEHAASTTVATSAETPARILFTATYPRSSSP
jgi:hypothetical protein